MAPRPSCPTVLPCPLHPHTRTPGPATAAVFFPRESPEPHGRARGHEHPEEKPSAERTRGQTSAGKRGGRGEDVLQQQDAMARRMAPTGKPPGEIFSLGLDRATWHTTTSVFCRTGDSSVPALHEAGGGRSCVTVGGHFSATSGPRQR